MCAVGRSANDQLQYHKRCIQEKLPLEFGWWYSTAVDFDRTVAPNKLRSILARVCLLPPRLLLRLPPPRLTRFLHTYWCFYFCTRLREECGSHARQEIESLQGQTPDCNAFLQLVDHRWQDHCSSMLTLRNVFLYLDRSFVLQTPSLRSIWDMGLELFRGFFQVRWRCCCWSPSEALGVSRNGDEREAPFFRPG